ncbi:hypothetical protein MKW92_046059, partial [Papaver armeniacum]
FSSLRTRMIWRSGYLSWTYMRQTILGYGKALSGYAPGADSNSRYSCSCEWLVLYTVVVRRPGYIWTIVHR